jgi:hypothetical protein
MSMPSPAKSYEIVNRKGGLFFVCLSCGHEISVDAFPGNKIPKKRTQAASAMKIHQQETHRVIS